MANNPDDAHHNHDFIDQLFDMHSYSPNPNLSPSDLNLSSGGLPMMLQLTSAAGAGFHAPSVFPLGLSLDQGNPIYEGSSGTAKRFRDDVLDPGPNNVFHGHPMISQVPAAVAPHQAGVRPRTRARRGQATDPHSIAERLRRERIAERIRALQELVPSVNKTDRAAMLDEIVDYVKFLRLQVKVLSMSRLGGAGAVVPLVTDMPISSIEEEGGEGQPVWDKWSNDGTERQVAKLMEENVGAAMQFLQSKALCIMPVSLASAIYHSQPPDTNSHMKPESSPPS